MDSETREGFIKLLGLILDLAQNHDDLGACMDIARTAHAWREELAPEDDPEPTNIMGDR